MSQQKSGGNRKAPNKPPGYYTRYYATNYLENKLRRILRHNGLSAARSWAAAKEAQVTLTRLLNRGVKVRDD